MKVFRGLVVAAVLGFVGCSGGDKPIDVTPVQTPAATNAKISLEEIATTGQMGSGMMLLRENIQQLKAADEAKGGPLMADLEALEKLTDPEQIKAKAKEMAGKL